MHQNDRERQRIASAISSMLELVVSNGCNGSGFALERAPRRAIGRATPSPSIWLAKKGKRNEGPAHLKTQTDQTVSENNEIDPAVMELGKTQYNLCLGCHGPTGQGMPNVGPPLAKSEWVAGPVENLIGIQLRGLQGAITVNGQDYQFAAPMVAMGAGQPDENIAAGSSLGK